MNKQKNVSGIDKQKIIIIQVLLATTILIMLLGVYFAIISIVNNISLKILNSSVHGVFLGLMVIYLGLRYYMSVGKLRVEVYKDTSKFSWSNFKKDKSQKVKL